MGDHTNTPLIDSLIELLHELRCTDGGCIFRVPGEPSGMVTNGGCRCLREYRDEPDRADAYDRKLRRAVQIMVKIVFDRSEVKHG